MAEKQRVKSFRNKCCIHLSVFSRAFPQNPSLTPTRIPSWQLEDDGPDLLAKTSDVPDETSGNGSSISEIEMINSDSNEQSGEENQ